MKKLLALVIAGVAVKYFLDSEQGKQLQNQLKGWLGEVQDTFTDSMDNANGRVKDVMNQRN